MESPNTRVTNRSTQVMKKEEIKNLRKPVRTSKVVNPFTRALAPPFIGRRRDFYILRLPSNQGNFLNVNTYMKVFYIPWFTGLISYIYKPTTSSHFKPGLFEMTSLTWLPRTFEVLFTRIITHQDSRIEESWNLPIHNFLNFTRFQSSWKQQHCIQKAKFDIEFTKYSEGQQLAQNSTELLSWTLSCYEFRISHYSHTHEHFHEFSSSDCFEGERFFLNSPTLATRGSRLTPTIRFHENSWNLVKKHHPRNVGVDTCLPENLQRSYRGGSSGLPPSFLQIDGVP
jgi:hypothetical protein